MRISNQLMSPLNTVVMAWVVSSIFYFMATSYWQIFFYASCFSLFCLVSLNKTRTNVSKFLLGIFGTFAIGFVWEIPILVMHINDPIGILYAAPQIFGFIGLMSQTKQITKQVIFCSTMIFIYSVGYIALSILGYIIIPWVPLLCRIFWLTYFLILVRNEIA